MERRSARFFETRNGRLAGSPRGGRLNAGMPSFEVFREPLHRRYVASLCSCTALFYVASLLLLLLTPYFIAYSASRGDFWLKSSTYVEQPDVEYQYSVLVNGFGTSAGGSDDLRVVYSTSNAVNALFPDEARSALLSSREVDANEDGLVDRVEVNLQLPLGPAEKLTSVDMLVFFQHRLKRRAKLVFDSLAHVSHSGGAPGRGFTVDGDLSVRQVWLAFVKGGFKVPYEDDPLFDVADISSAEQVSFGRILARHAARNLTAVFTPTYAHWQPESMHVPANGGALGDGGRVFNLTATFRIGQQEIVYTPGVGEVVKEAWVEYLAFLLLTYFLLHRLLAFVYYHQLVDTRVYVDSPSGTAVKKLHGL